MEPDIRSGIGKGGGNERCLGIQQQIPKVIGYSTADGI